MDPLNRAIALFDSKAHFAKEVGCYAQQLSRWLRTGRIGPAYCQRAEAACMQRAQFLLTLDRAQATQRQLRSIDVLVQGIPTCAQLRPDVFGQASNDGCRGSHGANFAQAGAACHD